jgi:hypothetical protein
VHRGRAIALVAAACAAGGCGPTATVETAGTAGSCAGPQAALAPQRAAVGQQVTYTVEWLAIGCRDTEPSDEVVEPLRDVGVEVVQGSGHAVVGRVSGAGERYSGSLRFVLPVWLRPGTAEVVLHAPAPERLTFTVAPGP